jgi:hypothetical protein
MKRKISFGDVSISLETVVIDVIIHEDNLILYNSLLGLHVALCQAYQLACQHH